MIDAHDLNPEVGPDVYSYPIQDMDKIILGQQAEMVNLLKRLVDFDDRARQAKAPDVIDLSSIKPTYNTKTGLRVLGIVISGQPITDTYRLLIGVRQYNFFGITNGFVQFPIEVTNGIDLTAQNITTPGSLTWSMYVFGYPF